MKNAFFMIEKFKIKR